jgi:DEAD/DEAH box helicase domain-containing protein
MMHDTFRPAVFIYDEVPGGIGLAEKLFESVDILRAMARQLVQLCPCESGCPSCLLSSRCESGNEPIDKKVTTKLL